jgi:hypothetical protein
VLRKGIKLIGGYRTSMCQNIWKDFLSRSSFSFWPPNFWGEGAYDTIGLKRSGLGKRKTSTLVKVSIRPCWPGQQRGKKDFPTTLLSFAILAAEVVQSGQENHPSHHCKAESSATRWRAFRSRPKTPILLEFRSDPHSHRSLLKPKEGKNLIFW